MADRRLPLGFSVRSLSCLSLMFLAACGAQDCSCTGFEARPFPPQHYDKTVPQSTQIRVTPQGLDFVEDNIEPLVSAALPDGLSFCLPKDTSSDTKLCFPYVRGRSGHHMQGEQPVCDSGVDGCQLNLVIEGTEIRPVPPRGLEIDVLIGGLNPTLPFETRLPVIGSRVTCDVTAYRKGGGIDDAATVRAIVPMEFLVDNMSPTKDIKIDVDDIGINLDDLDFDLKGGALCSTADFLRGLFRGTIEGQIRDQLKSAVDGIVRQNLCLSCEMSPCPGASVCAQDNICEYASGECVPASLGVEGALNLSATIGDFTETPNANVDTFFKLSDYASVDTGLTLAMRTGFQPERLSDCVPIDPASRPSFAPVPISPTLIRDVRPGTSDPFDVGIGIHKGMLEHLLWGAWASGATCLKIESASTPQITTGALGLFVPSLKALTDGVNSQAALKIVPQTAPTITLGSNQVMETPSGYEVVDGLFTLDWKDLDLHIYGWAQDRWTRLVTVRLDMLLPIAVVPDGAGSVGIVLGDLEAALQNLRGQNGEILKERPEVLAEIIPSLVGIALPSLAGALDQAFELPEFFGLRIVLEQGGITSIDSGEFIALFANLETSMQTTGLQVLPAPRIEALEVTYPEERGTRTFTRPTVHLDMSASLGIGIDRRELLAGADVEYAWRVDEGFWSLYHKRSDLQIKDPVLALPGEHTIEVRARVAGSDVLVNREDIATQKILIDYQPPTLTLEREADALHFIASDLTDSSAHLSFRSRIHDGERALAWSTWSHASQLDLSTLDLDQDFRVEVEVKDRSGLSARDMYTVRLAVPGDAIAPAQESSQDPDASAPVAGCAQAPSGVPSTPWLLGVGLLGMLGLTRRRRAHLIASAVTLLGLGATTAGCGGCGDTASSDKSPLVPVCDTPCADDEVCTQGMCIEKDPMPCSTSAECTNAQLCEQGVCVDPECREDADCGSVCGAAQRGTCSDNACACERYCAQGCGDTDFCCFESNACQPIPEPCDGKVCEPGFEPGNPVAGTPDSSSCRVPDATCECVPSLPLPLGMHGRWADMTSSQTTIAVSAYNQTYGDLMVGVLGANNAVTWEFVDGVPATGDIAGATNGPRGGIKTAGLDVGAYTASVFDDAGALHVFYQDRSSSSLKYARGIPAGEAFTWTTTPLALAGGEAGWYNDAYFAGGVVHLVTLVDNVPASGGGPQTSQLRHLQLDPAAALDALTLDASEVLVSGPASKPCAEACAGDDVCLRDLGQCVTPATTCAVPCVAGFACHMSACVASTNDSLAKGPPTTTGNYPELTGSADGSLLLTFHDGAQGRVGWMSRDTSGSWSTPGYVEQGTGPYGSAVRAEDGTIHIAYMHEPSKTLRYHTISPQGADKDPEIIARGLRDTGSEWLVERIGEDVQIQLNATNQPEVIFHDATLHSLMYARREASGAWMPSTLSKKNDPFDGSHGFYPALLRAGPMSLVVEYVMDRQAKPEIATPLFHTLP